MALHARSPLHSTAPTASVVLDGDVADISRSRTIKAPLQTIWDVLADFGALSAWARNVDHSCLLTSGPDDGAVGTTRRVQMGRNTFVERIVEFDPTVALAYDVTGLPTRLGLVVNRWTLQPSADATTVTLTSRVEIGSNPVARAAEWVVCRGLARELDAMLDGLTRRLEYTNV